MSTIISSIKMIIGLNLFEVKYVFFCLCIIKDNLIYFLNIFHLFICCWAFKKKKINKKKINKKKYLWNMYMCVNSGMFFSMVLCEYQLLKMI